MKDTRMFLWVILTVAGLAAFGAVRPSSPDPNDDLKTEQTHFFLNKTHGIEDAPAIILGDSRALRGLSPEAIASELPTPRFANFAFESGGMNAEMYDAVEARLGRDGTRVVLLAITPLAFMPWKVGNDQYHEYLRTSPEIVWIDRRRPEFLEFFEPVAPVVFVQRALNWKPQVAKRQVFHDSGWIESDQNPDAVAMETERAPGRLAGNAVSADLIGDFMARTAAWKAAGIRVFAVRPPSTPAMSALEDSILGFDQAHFVTSFTEAGGIWLPGEEGRYRTYDASHLRAGDAVEYSREIGRAIRGHLAAAGAIR